MDGHVGLAYAVVGGMGDGLASGIFVEVGSPVSVFCLQEALYAGPGCWVPGGVDGSVAVVGAPEF